MRRFAGLRLGAMLGAMLGMAGVATAQDWPSRPITMVVPYAAGGGTDVIARAVAEKLQARLGVGVVVENRAGAGGNLGTTAAAQAPADGYTVLISNIGPMAVNPSLFKNLKYDPAEVLEPVTLIAKAPLLLLVHPSVKANSVAELIALSKAQPEGLTYGTAGHGSANHIATALFELMAQTNLKHAAYRGAGPALNDLIGGHIPMMFATLPSAIGHVHGGTLRALAVTTSERAPALPAVPTLAEAGVPGYEASGWYGVFVRKGTPQPIIDKLRSEVATIINLPEVRRSLELEGAQPIGNTPQEFAAFVKAEREKWAKVVAQANIKVE
ncbi:putative exported protein [Bosea sp. LC85]|uniref:Bug family tripartite tricarboxylate transporter substrate binding protein n=1 Tax=Bosea sp. LC85 TaxID=1502851 RepID=UPI0004E35AC8|nr:tripartite tricarboxylate transporter substrate binding protein [Bosea sp. LC85]KFC65228.1 putative exported protein [Bosea sp. LC85]